MYFRQNRTFYVNGWVDTDTYNPNAAGSYTFTATLGAIPSGYANTGNHTATIEVVVAIDDVLTQLETKVELRDIKVIISVTNSSKETVKNNKIKSI